MTFSEGETLYLQEDNGSRHWFRLRGGMIKVQSLGSVDGSRILPLDDGDAIDVAGRRFNVFRPGLPELSDSLDRGAQIITPKDASAILYECDIKSGDRVIEVGAGSGGLTTALLHAVAPNGHVHTVELFEKNAKKALKNVSRTGLDAYWSYQIGDARTDEVEFDGADAIVTDMPDIENALDNLCPHLRNGGRICAYVPYANQLEKAVRAFREKGFCDIRPMEIFRRGMEVTDGGIRPAFTMAGHTGYLAFARKRTP